MAYEYRTSFTAADRADREETIVDGRFSSSGDIALSDGSVTQGAIYFADDKNTGIYSPSNDQIAFTTSGSAALTIANNDATFAGDVTVSTTKPTITLNDTNSESDFWIQNDDGVFAIKDLDTGGGIGRLTIASNGQTTISGNCDFSNGIDVTGNATFSKDITANNISGKNLVINGGFDIWQRGTDSGSGTTDGVLTADRWTIASSGATRQVTRQAFTVGQTDVPGNPKYYLRYAVTTGNDNVALRQKIEDLNTVANKELTLSFWIKGSNPGGGHFQLEQRENFGSGGSSPVNTVVAAEYTVTGSWVKKTFTFTPPSIAGKTLGTGHCYELEIFRQPSDDTSTAAYTVDIANVQLEVGSIATPFEQKTYAETLRECQRYYYKMVEGNGVGHTNGVYISQGSYYQANLFSTVFSFPTTMRATPTLDYESGTDYYMIFTNNTADNADSFALTRAHPNGGGFDVTGSVSGTQGHGGSFSTKHASAKIAFESEL